MSTDATRRMETQTRKEGHKKGKARRRGGAWGRTGGKLQRRRNYVGNAENTALQQAERKVGPSKLSERPNTRQINVAW